MNTTSFGAMDAWFNRNRKYAEFYHDMMVKENRDTKKYKHIVLGFDVSADFREINRILTKNKRWLQFIKSSPIFFMDQDDEIIKCDELDKDLKLWLMSCEQEYYVFLNCGIRRYDDYLENLKALDDVKYDISYPIFERFDNEKDALAFYEKVESLLDAVRLKESIKQKFNPSYILGIKSYDYHREKLDSFEKTIYCFNNSQKLSIFLQKADSGSTYYIFLNRKIEMCFDNAKSRDECWEYLTNFYEKFEKKTIKGISTQLFLTDFFSELMQNAEEVKEFKKEEGKVSWLRCEFKGYHIFFRLISRNGRYGGKAFEFRIYKCGMRMSNQEWYERYNIQPLKSIMQQFFPEEEFMEKYFSC